MRPASAGGEECGGTAARHRAGTTHVCTSLRGQLRRLTLADYSYLGVKSRWMVQIGQDKPCAVGLLFQLTGRGS